MLWKASNDGPDAWIPVPYMEDPDKAPGFGQAHHCFGDFWRVNQPMEESCSCPTPHLFFSTLSLSPLLVHTHTHAHILSHLSLPFKKEFLKGLFSCEKALKFMQS